MLDLMLAFFLLGIFPLFLHEFGHWVILKRYKIPYRFFIDWKYGVIGFETKGTSKEELKAGLMGAFVPLLILIPLALTFNLILIFLGVVVCLVYAIWSCSEVWWNLKG